MLNDNIKLGVFQTSILSWQVRTGQKSFLSHTWKDACLSQRDPVQTPFVLITINSPYPAVNSPYKSRAEDSLRAMKVAEVLNACPGEWWARWPHNSGLEPRGADEDAGSGGPKLVSSRQRDGSCCDSECGWRQLYISGDAKVALCPARETRAWTALCDDWQHLG